jgi:hypothetical protein
VAVSCEHGNELSASMKYGVFVDKPRVLLASQ